MSPVRRGQILIRAFRILEDRQEEIAQLITREQGKTLAESRGEVPRAIQFSGLELQGYQGSSIQGVTAPAEADEVMALTLREPLGVVSLITPWNFPVNVSSRKLASALVCGNTVVLKPAQLTPLCAVALVEALVEAGIPDGVVNLVLGSGAEVGEVLVTDERVKAISFTGSTAAGLGINTKAAPLGKKVQAEMGGHNAVIVLEDADPRSRRQGRGGRGLRHDGPALHGAAADHRRPRDRRRADRAPARGDPGPCGSGLAAARTPTSARWSTRAR